MKKVRNIRWHTVLIDTLKTETSNFALNSSLHWKLVECSEIMHKPLYSFHSEEVFSLRSVENLIS